MLKIYFPVSRERFIRDFFTVVPHANPAGAENQPETISPALMQKALSRLVESTTQTAQDVCSLRREIDIFKMVIDADKKYSDSLLIEIARLHAENNWLRGRLQ